MRHQEVTLDDKFLLTDGRVFITGVQTLLRVLIDQNRLDRAAGLNTAGFVSGYRGSPLGGLDQQAGRAGKYLKAAEVVFKEGLNEDLAATAVWGSQQANLFPGARYDGVFGMWYGKAPGVDRTGDAFKHANFAGVFPKGGVLAVAGDSTGISKSWKAYSDWDGRVEDLQVWSSPATARTPPLGQTPAKLACLKASPVRSTPGALPYHMP